MTRLEQVAAEEWPTGTFGGPRPVEVPRVPTSPEAAAEHRASLLAELRRRRLEEEREEQLMPTERQRTWNEDAVPRTARRIMPHQVDEVRARVQDGATYAELAAEYGVSYHTIRRYAG